MAWQLLRTPGLRCGVLAVALLGAACGGDDGADAAPGTTRAAASPAGADGEAAPSTAPAAGGSGESAPDGSTAATTATTAAAPADPGDVPALGQVRAQLRQLARFEEPVALSTRPGDPRPGTVYVVERAGTIRAMAADGSVAATPTVDLSARTAAGGERGLLGLAFSADGSKLFVNYTDREGDTNVDELTMAPDGTAKADTRRRLLFIEQPYANHNGGHLAVGPDGMLYVGMGDGGSGGDPEGYGQDLGSLLGKMLRIDPTPSGGQPYTVPADNPFVGRAGVRPEIWSWGLRNPWGFDFDPATGDLWIADVGQSALEEINVARAADGGGRAVNFGWNAFEGTERFEAGVDAPGAVDPAYQYRHGNAQDEGCSVTGGVVYRGDTIANLAGAYVFADYCVAGIRAIPTVVEDGADELREQQLTAQPANVVAFGLDAQGEVLVATLDGAVSRLVPR